MELIKDIGMKYPTEKSNYKKRYGLYLCPDCSSEIEMIISDVKSRNTKRCKSCGIIKAKTTHGFNRTPLHSVWLGIRSRCLSLKSSNYKYYGEVGVGICYEWANDFVSFRQWCIDNNYEKGMHISRIGDSGDYKPSNCRIVTKKENVGERNKLYALKMKEKL